MRDSFVVTLIYAALTIALTWPLARGLTRDIPGDFGDPLFTSWVLAWDATHLGRGLWHANIFYPHPIALAYSETFLPQALQILPIYAATANPILCYNLLFLSTFVLSGLGMFLFGRELTGSRTAGFVAGLAYAFAPYRVPSLPHLQVLSAAWLPFVLFGLRRFFTTGRVRPLAGAAAAWITQNLSCGYYLLFFSPAIALYILWELTMRGAWREWRTVWRVAAACAVVLMVTTPFLLPYLEVRRLGFDVRSLTETKKFSADVYAYFTADPRLWLWGSVAQAWPKSEGLLFPGVTIVALAAIGAASSASHAGRSRSRQHDIARRSTSAYPLWSERFALVIVAAGWGIAGALLLAFSIRLPGLKITSLWRTLLLVCGMSAMLLMLFADTRAAVRRWLASPAGFFTALTVAAVVMSFGPVIYAGGRLVAETGPYAAFYRAVPGFDGLRVPARFGMLVAFGLATLTALGVARLSRVRALAPVASVLILLEALAVPMPINQNPTDFAQTGLAPPPSIALGAGVPGVYRAIGELPASAVLVELPLGEPAFDIRYMFYSITHWRPLVNGYSGGAPGEYGLLSEALKEVTTRPDRAWNALVASQATHAIVHEAFYADGGGPKVSNWLRAHGAREVVVDGSDHLFALR